MMAGLPSPWRRRTFAHDQVGRKLDAALGRTTVVGAVEQDSHGHRSHFPERLAHGRQSGSAPLTKRDVIETDDTQIFGDTETCFSRQRAGRRAPTGRYRQRSP